MPNKPYSLTVIILAAGSASRFKANKMLVPLAGHPLFCHSLRTFLPLADDLELVIPESDQELFKQVLTAENLPLERISLISGGSTRTASVTHGLQAMQDASSDRLVAIHDAARPLATAALLQNLCEAAWQYGGAAPGRPVVDTMLSCDDEDLMRGVVPREHTWAISTPQVFRLQQLKAAYAALGDAVYTDDTQVFYHHGGTVKLVPEGSCNLKVTYPEDLERAETALKILHK